MVFTRRLPYVAILTCTIFATLFLFISPPTTTPDEIAHLAYPRFVTSAKQLPSFISYEDFWESHQPPLYYLISIPITKLFSSVPVYTQIQLDRFTSWFLYVGALFSMLFLSKKLFANQSIIQTGAIIVLGIPMVAYLAGAFSNDILMLLISIWVSYWVFIKAKMQLSLKDAVFFGLVLGAGLLTKTHLYPLLFVATIIVLWRKKFILWVVTAISTLSISGWWFAHNFRTVGDIFGLSNTKVLWQSQYISISNFSEVEKMIEKIFSGFFGVFGKFNIAFPLFVYIVLAVGSLILVIYALIKYREKNIQRLSALILVSILFVVIQNFTFFQPQGRYLLSIVPLVAILFGFGLTDIKKKETQRLVVGVVALVVLVLNSYGLFLVHSYFENNPVSSMVFPRSISLTEVHWNGQTDKIESSKDSIILTLPVKLFTLQDMRLATSGNPVVHLFSNNANDVAVRVFWKRLGDSSFTVERSIETFFTNSILDIELPINEETLLQDIQVEFKGAHDSIMLQEFSLSN